MQISAQEMNGGRCAWGQRGAKEMLRAFHKGSILIPKDEETSEK